MLEYRVVLEGGCDVCFQWDGLQGVLYESRFHCQFFTLYNACNQRVFHGDAFDGRKMCKISGGEGGVYMVRLDIRHPTPTILENLADLPCVIVRSLTKAVPLTFYYRKSDCLIGSAQGKVNSEEAGTEGKIFLSMQRSLRLRQGCTPQPRPKTKKKTNTTKEPYKQQLQVGDVLLGTVSYIKDLYASQFIGASKGGSLNIDPHKSLDGFRCKLVVGDCRKVEADKLAVATPFVEPAACTSSGVVEDEIGEGGKAQGKEEEADNDVDKALERQFLTPR